MIDRRLKLLLPSQPQSLNAIREEIEELVSKTDYETRVPDIQVVVSEACTNVVRHAYAEMERRPVIIVECVLREDVLKIIVRDRGRGLARCVDEPVFSEEGGFGLFLIERLSDGFECYSSPGFGTMIEVLFKNPRRVTSKGRWRRRRADCEQVPPELRGLAGRDGDAQDGTGCRIVLDEKVLHYI